MNGTSGNGHRIPRSKQNLFAFKDDPKSTGQHGVDLVHAVGVVGKRSAGSICIPGHCVTPPFQACPQHGLIDGAIPSFVPPFYVDH